MNSPNRPAFTLIELLVVVTIIVVLLALLVPAMSKAIYQAELATCGANLRGVVNGTVLYAMSNKRSYPVREAIQAGSNWSPSMIYNGNPAYRAYWSQLAWRVNVDIYDDRKILRQFMSLKSLVDPLTGKVDYEDTDEDSNAFSSISLWFGFGIRGQKAMNRLGDRWTWFDKINNKTWRFDVVAGDTDIYSGGAVQISHPDHDGAAANRVYQNTDFRDTPGFKTVASLWEARQPGRGLTDLNFALSDGSVSRYDGVAYRDPEMAQPMYYNTIPGWWAILPPQQ